MHIWTHLKPESIGKTGLGVYPDGMVEHDAMVGELLDKLKELGIDDNTIVMYSSDNGAETMSWPDGGTTVFRSEKNTNWEGGYRVPCVDSLAWRHQTRHHHQRHRLARRHGSHADGCGRRPHRERGPGERRQNSETKPLRSTSMATT